MPLDTVAAMVIQARSADLHALTSGMRRADVVAARNVVENIRVTRLELLNNVIQLQLYLDQLEADLAHEEARPPAPGP